MKKKILLSIIMPCYNEEQNIHLIVERFKQVKPENRDIQLILVDNGSTDNSNSIIKSYEKQYPFIKLVHVEKNIGYGFGIWSGLKKAEGTYLCWTHADMQTDLKDTMRALAIIQRQKNPENCFIKGKRKGRAVFDSFFTVGMSIFETLLLKKMLYEINAQPNLFHNNFLARLNNPPKDFSFDLYFYYMAQKLNYKIIRFPVFFNKRIHGESHWNISLKGKYKFIKRTIDFSFKLRKRLK